MHFALTATYAICIINPSILFHMEGMGMKYVIASLKSVSPYSQSRMYEAEAIQGEGFDDKAKRTWRSYLHTDANGVVFIPPTAFGGTE